MAVGKLSLDTGGSITEVARFFVPQSQPWGREAYNMAAPGIRILEPISFLVHYRFTIQSAMPASNAASGMPTVGLLKTPAIASANMDRSGTRKKSAIRMKKRKSIERGFQKLGNDQMQME